MDNNYVFCKYSFPNPNDGNNYKFTPAELVKLLDKVYENGFEHARDIYDPARRGTTSWASSEDIDDSNRWKEA